MMKVIAAEVRSGFARLRGAHVHAVVPLSQELLDRMLARAKWSLSIRRDNRLLITYGSFRTEAEIVGITPDLTAVLSTSWLSRTALRGVLAWKPAWKTYVGQQDGRVYVFCGSIPAVARYRNVWQHVSRIHARTTPGKLIFEFDLDIRERKPSHGLNLPR